MRRTGPRASVTSRAIRRQDGMDRGREGLNLLGFGNARAPGTPAGLEVAGCAARNRASAVASSTPRTTAGGSEHGDDPQSQLDELGSRIATVSGRGVYHVGRAMRERHPHHVLLRFA